MDVTADELAECPTPLPVLFPPMLTAPVFDKRLEVFRQLVECGRAVSTCELAKAYQDLNAGSAV